MARRFTIPPLCFSCKIFKKQFNMEYFGGEINKELINDSEKMQLNQTSKVKVKTPCSLTQPSTSKGLDF